MVKWILKTIVGNKNQREIKKIRPIVERINFLEKELQSHPESILKEKAEFWKRHLDRYKIDLELFSRRILQHHDEAANRKILTDWSERFDTLSEEYPKTRIFVKPNEVKDLSGDELVEQIVAAQEIFVEIRDGFPKSRSQYLDSILPEAYAVVKNAARRLCGTEWLVCDHPVKWEMVHFDVQLIGGIALHRGFISEMATGEGKTLVATLPVFLNALTGLGVHVVTVNDYLARRDAEWMGHLFEYLGLSIGCIQNDQDKEFRKAQYQKDITYGTASEFGFDYLRDNGMAQSRHAQVQRSHYFCLIDEADSVLIDEARTPLIISGPVIQRGEQQFDRYKGPIQALFRKQSSHCNDLASEAKKLFEAGDLIEAGNSYYKIKLAQPRNRALMRAMEDAEIRKLIDKAELEFYRDPQKKALFALKEELYFTVDEKQHEAELTEKGRQFMSPDDPDAFVLPDLASAFSVIEGDSTLSSKDVLFRKQEIQEKMNLQAERMHTISQLLKAYALYEKDNQYVVEDNKVIIVDENTGRKMSGRRWSDGLHQAVEAKENVTIEGETQTYATITIQNYFRLYEKIGGMTGTAETEAAEFHDIYKTDVMIIPTNRPIARIDQNDKIFKTQREKFKSVIETIKEAHFRGQPILLGTASVEASEILSRMLKREKIPHSVLNAKYHMQEAEIVACAGRKGAVTVATNMAGRGTDIKLDEGVKELGGLFVIGTERHQSRRIDRQLRGRCSRQGDPGLSIFFVSFEDELMMQFGAADRMTKMMERFGLEDGQELEHPWLNKSVENAQKKVEQRNYQSRKHVLEYDDVMNNQRTVIYGYRNEVMNTEDPHGLVIDIIEEAIPARLAEFVNLDNGKIEWDHALNWVRSVLPLNLTREGNQFDERTNEENITFVIDQAKGAYNLKCAHEDPEVLEDLERFVILNSVDHLWQEHLYAMDGLREGISNYRHAQKDPLIEYKVAAFDLFVELMSNIKGEVLQHLFTTTTMQSEVQFSQLIKSYKALNRPDLLSDLASGNKQTASDVAEQNKMPPIELPKPVRRELPKVGRNDLCPCGSNKKYKQCCGKL